tara:strand:- start:152 stop:1813 length:1662 start_codon:yes stop_codon:yes gene_type:complete
MPSTFTKKLISLAFLLLTIANTPFADTALADSTVRVFIFAGQSNMVGSDSKVQDIKRFAPFRGLEDEQPHVRFTYCLGRENKTRSEGWVNLQPVNNIVGPELSFARAVTRQIDAPIAIIKVAAGGTHLGGDWNPDNPSGFEMYPLALKTVRDSLQQLDAEGLKYRIEGFMWHQGENDMFNQQYMDNYGKNLKNFLRRWRTDLDVPELDFYIGELCTKTIWGMDLRPRMYAISLGQKEVTAADKHAHYIPTAHIGAEIGNPVGLHYHYGTLGQLEHGENYASAYLNKIGVKQEVELGLQSLPYSRRKPVKLFVLAGHRNMEGERAFVSELSEMDNGAALLKPQNHIAYRYSLGGGVKTSLQWEPLRPAGYYQTFGPEVSFGARLSAESKEQIAIAKFTHSGSQIIDWTPEGSMAKTRHIYPDFIEFIRQAQRSLSDKGFDVEIAGIFYHLGENDMSFYPYRKDAAERLKGIVAQSRVDLKLPELAWYVSQQKPTDHESVNKVDVVSMVSTVAEDDPHLHHLKAFDLPPQEQRLVITTEGIVRLGEALADFYLDL